LTKKIKFLGKSTKWLIFGQSFDQKIGKKIKNAQEKFF